MQNTMPYREAMTTAWRLVGERGMMTVNFAPWTETVEMCVLLDRTRQHDVWSRIKRCHHTRE